MWGVARAEPGQTGEPLGRRTAQQTGSAELGAEHMPTRTSQGEKQESGVLLGGGFLCFSVAGQRGEERKVSCLLTVLV